MNMLSVNVASEFTFHLRLLTVVVCVGIFVRLTADENPTVVYAVVNQTARLPCSLPMLVPPRVEWFDLVYNTDRRPKKIFSGGSGAGRGSVEANHTNRNNYDVNVNFTLFIGGVRLDDAGTYFCTSRQTNLTLVKTYYLAVAGFPICRGANPIGAGQIGQYSCESAFSGNYVPRLEWRREPNNTWPSADDFNVRLAKEVFDLEASESDDGTTFTCRISFGSVDGQCTINLTVHYPVRNVVIEPIKKSFSVGEEIRCSADGNPAPEITFEPALSPRGTGPGWGSVTVQKSVGDQKTRVVNCVATNVVDGKRTTARRSFEFSVESNSSVDGAEEGNNGNPKPAQSKSSSTTGAIVAGIVVGIMILVILVGIVVCIRLRKQRKPAKEENGGSKTSSSARTEPKTPIKENQV